MNSRIAIAGAGMCGAYLYRLLANRGVHADLFDRVTPTRCALKPCAWGTSRGFEELVRAAGLDPEAYVLSRIPYVEMDEFRIPAGLVTFDKPRLIGDLLGEGRVCYDPIPLERYRRVVDATGTARSYLPALDHDFVLPCVQTRVAASVDLGNRIRLGGIGYAWCFPLGGETYHIGCGSVLGRPQDRLAALDWVDAAGGAVLCRCNSQIRLTGPHGAQPFVAMVGETEVWGVGEAIGCVAPLAGDGIVTGMRSVALVLEHWDNPCGYTAQILREFHWMKSERGVLDKLLAQRRLGVADALVLRRNSRRMGMEVRLGQALLLMERLGASALAGSYAA